MLNYDSIYDINLINFNSLNLFLFIILTLICAILIDITFGELPVKIHPVVIIGHIINFFKNIFIKINNKISGLLLVVFTSIITLTIVALLIFFSTFNLIIYFIIFTILLSSTFSIKMLLETAINVKNNLDESLEKARESVSYLVSRNTQELTESFIVSATIESMTENITDSYVAPIFYYFIFGSLLLIFSNNNFIILLLLISFFYRISNTLDAMIGYENDELKIIGYIPAKLDDVLNYIPSRIAGIYIVISSCLLKYNYKNSYKMFKRDAKNCPSPNSGFTMATTAGALDIQLIKKETYVLGDKNKEIDSTDINKAVKLSKITMFLFTITIIFLLTIIYVIS